MEINSTLVGTEVAGMCLTEATVRPEMLLKAEAPLFENAQGFLMKPLGRGMFSRNIVEI